MKKQKRLVAMALLMVSSTLLSGCTITKFPVPEVKKARFNFSVTYEIDGVEQVYSGVYVCEYDGIYVTCVGKGREWDGYIENEGDDIFIPVQERENEVIYIDLGFYPEYFMSDPDNYSDDVPVARLLVEVTDEEGFGSGVETDQDLIFEDFGARVISYEYDAPIENVYKSQWSIGDFELTIN